jgi:hypothetical protein
MHGVKAGQSLFFKGEVYFPLTTFDDVNYPVRKLLYWQPHLAAAKYGGSGDRTFYSVLVMQGSGLFIESGFVAQDGTARGVNAKVATLRPQTWYAIEKQITAESSIGAGDGVIRIWIDGVQVFEKTNMSWSDVAWIGQPIPAGNGTPLLASDVYFDTFLVGEQVNYGGAFDEYRYWNNVSFSTTRPTN